MLAEFEIGLESSIMWKFVQENFSPLEKKSKSRPWPGLGSLVIWEFAICEIAMSDKVKGN